MHHTITYLINSKVFNFFFRIVNVFPGGSWWKWKWRVKKLAFHSENEDHGTWSHHFMANRWGNSDRLYFLGGSKITADGDCSHEIKRRLLLGRKVMSNLDSIFKSRDITLLTKVRLVKAMVFPVVMWELDCEEGWVPGASVRNSAHGKGHEEGGLAYAKAWSSLRKPPGPEHLPQNQSLFYALPHNRFSRRRSKRAASRQ